MGLDVDHYKRLSDYKPLKPAVRVGADVDAWCTRCKQQLSHTVLAMEGSDPVRVMCNTCKSQHNYRADKAKSKTGSRKSPRSRGTGQPPKPRPARAFERVIRDKNLQNPRPYSPKDTFLVDQVILHGKFGIGVVQEVRQGGKISVVFEDETRTLVHARD